ncbi:hypothetical protein N0V93_001980 [Gnomoniopsis smithogilvyi]|uniref:Uncharacterized protein n=1 Tax=Gnomoniopsis smithogilvyi TaxID=1191159 RepID=A0A9W9D347_9PEZI|nr:hypothetical protein N0V93_001980 [Gnomoniopsis smithogilvyi]
MAAPSHTVGSADLQNSYGPEIAATQNQPSNGLEAVPVSGLEALPGQQAAVPEPSTYTQQAEKNDDYSAEAAAPATPRKRVLGLPLWGVWLLVSLAIIVLGVALGVGLGVGLSNRSSSSGGSDPSAAASSSSSSSSSASPTITTTAQAITTTATPTTSKTSTKTTSTTSSSTSASTTGASVEICQNAYLDSCTTISVPASSCINFPSSYNDSVSSVNTGGPTCLFYTDSSCTGDYWSTSGSQDLIPGDLNDAFSSVTCD